MSNPSAKEGRNIYLELIYRFPLRPIRSDEELDEAIQVINSLLDKDVLDPWEEDYLDILSDLVERYEEVVYPIEPVSDAEMLSYLIEVRGVNQADVARATGIAESTISEILAGKRKLTRSHIGKLAGYFHVEPGVFSFAD